MAHSRIVSGKIYINLENAALIAAALGTGQGGLPQKEILRRRFKSDRTKVFLLQICNFMVYAFKCCLTNISISVRTLNMRLLTVEVSGGGMVGVDEG